ANAHCPPSPPNSPGVSHPPVPLPSRGGDPTAPLSQKQQVALLRLTASGGAPAGLSGATVDGQHDLPDVLSVLHEAVGLGRALEGEGLCHHGVDRATL